jgi:predicted HTH domain antitoxin
MTTKFEYTTFTLANYPTVASKYKKICEDLTLENSRSFFNKNKSLIQLLGDLKSEYESSYPKEELVMTEAKESEYWIKRLAKEGAVELIAQGRVTSETMFKISSLPRKQFEECVAEVTKIASYLNHVTKEAEKVVTPDDIVPDDVMS